MSGMGPVHKFRALEWGELVGSGATNPRYVTFQAIAKIDWEEHFCVAGVEFLCGRLAQLLGIPCPIGGITTTEDNKTAYFSLDFSDLTVTPAPIVPPQFIGDHLDIATGIALFDSWILNNDRSVQNLAVVGTGLGAPIAFDHSHALGANGTRTSLLGLHRRVTEPLAHHCLQNALDDGRYVAAWRDRIRAMSRELMLPAFQQVVALGALTEAEASSVLDFVVHRRDHAMAAMTALFHNVNNWPM
jgi:hypothetical protein